MCMEAMDNFFIAVILLTAHFTLGRSSGDCIPKQTLRHGESGTIPCAIEDGYFGVYWYDTQDLTQQPVIFSEDGQIGGRGYTSGEFNLISGGSLLIVQVAAKHERIFTVVILENRDSDKLIQHTIQVFVIALPSLPYPDIKQCESKQYCYKKIHADNELECAVHDARPPVHLTWVWRTTNNDSDVTFQRTYSANVNLNTTKATMRLRSSLHCHFHLFVCRAKDNAVLENLESYIITEVEKPSTDLSKAIYKEIEKDDSITLQCSGDKILFFIWKKTMPGRANVVIAHGYVLAGTKFSIQPYSIDRYGTLTFLQFNESQEGVYACYTSDGNKETVTSYNLTTVSLVTQPIVTSGNGITEIAAEQKNTAAIVIPICLALFGTLVVLVSVIVSRKKSIKGQREKDNQGKKELDSLVPANSRDHEEDGRKDSVESELDSLVPAKSRDNEEDGRKDSVESDAIYTMDGVTVENGDSSKHPELDSSVPAKSRDNEEDGRKDSVESGPHVKHNELSEGENNKERCGLSNVTSNQDGNPSICKDESILCSGEITIQKFCVGNPTVGRAKKVILVLAEGGAGKPEVVTNLVNYLIGFKWNSESKNELKIDLVQESRSENPSIVHWINIYGSQNDRPFDITIVDLPECIESETTAVIRYNRVANLVHQLTEGDAEHRLEQVDAILLVQKYSPQRETPHTLGTILAQNLRNNIYNFLTFSLEEFDKLVLTENQIERPFVGDIVFNNSYLMPRVIAKNTSNMKFKSTAYNHFDKFLNFLRRCDQIEFTQSSEVFENRKNLEELLTQIQNTKGILRNQEGRLCEAKSTLAAIKDKNKRAVEVRLKKGERAVNCEKCKTTCHYPCTHYFVRTCSCMKWLSDARGCSVCKKSCAPSHHTQDSFKYKTIKDKEEEIKQHRGIVEKAETDLKAAKEVVQKRAIEIRICLENLSRIALEPTVLSIEGDLIKETVSKGTKWEDFSERDK